MVTHHTVSGWGRGARRLLVPFCILAGVVAPRSAAAHPIHSTLTELAVQQDGSVTVRIRTFADDFSLAVARYAGATRARDYSVPDAAAARYTTSVFALADAGGHSIPLQLISQRRTGDVVWLAFKAAKPLPLHGARVLNTMLFEVHADQVNILQASYGAVRHSTLFSRGDKAKTLP